MKAEQLLRRPERIEKRILVLVTEIDHIRQSLLPGGFDYSLDRVQGGEGADKYPAAMDKIIEREEQIRELIAEREYLINERIPELIALVSDERAQDILRIYYLCRKSLREVAEIVHWSVPTVNRLKHLGLAEIDTHLYNNM